MNLTSQGISIDHCSADLLADFITKDGLKARGPLPISLEQARRGLLPREIHRMIQRRPVQFANTLPDATDYKTPACRIYQLVNRNPVTYEEV